MTRPHPKPSDRGRDNPEPGPPPGTRASQRDTTEQLEAESGTGEGPLGWERAEQDELPPRGEGSQQNQGGERGPTIGEGARRTDETPGVPEGLHSGGNRRPSNDNNKS